jgi:hypothetical protein
MGVPRARHLRLSCLRRFRSRRDCGRSAGAHEAPARDEEAELPEARPAARVGVEFLELGRCRDGSVDAWWTSGSSMTMPRALETSHGGTDWLEGSERFPLTPLHADTFPSASLSGRPSDCASTP